MTLTESIIIIVGLAALLVIAGLLLGNYLKHQNDHVPITGTTITPPAPSDEQPVDPPTLKVKKDANTDITNPPNAPTTTATRKRNAKGQFTK